MSKNVVDVMTRTISPQDLSGGKGKVRAPQRTDAMAGTLRNAYRVDRGVPGEIDDLMTRLCAVT